MPLFLPIVQDRLPVRDSLPAQDTLPAAGSPLLPSYLVPIADGVPGFLSLEASLMEGHAPDFPQNGYWFGWIDRRCKPTLHNVCG